MFLLLLYVSTSVMGQQAGTDGQITLEDIWLRYAFYPEFPNEFRWMQDDQYYSVLEKEVISRYSIKDEKKVDDILDLNEIEFTGEIKAGDIKTYSFNDDESKVLLKANMKSIYRRSTKENCMVYDRKAKKLFTLQEGQSIGNATFSPDSKKIAYTYNNDLYFFNFESGETVRITDDGKEDHIINGSTDWVYEEELEFVRAFFWSPDSRYISYYRFDESAVREFTMPMYDNLYPTLDQFKYPKAGEDNSLVTVYLFDVNSKQKVQGDIGKETDQYIARMAWTPGSKDVAVMRLNRLQNKLDLLFIDAKTGKSRIMLTEENPAYIEVSDDKWHFLSDNSGFLWTSEMDGYNHIYQYDMKGKLKNAITKGDFEVSEILSVDEENKKIYFLSTEDSPLERHLYTVNFDGKKKKRLTKAKGMHDISFSSANNYYIDSYSSAGDPGKTVLVSSAGKVVKTLVTNDKLRDKLGELAIKDPEFFSFKTSNGDELNGWMIKPHDFSASKQYPVLMFVYGGPGSQTVKNDWGYFNYMWYQMLAQKGYIIVSVDNRGTGARGAEFKKSTYGKLGELETIDQIEAAKYLKGLDYVDGSRIGIWGWSFGGYLTSLCMVKGEGIFKAGIAVAPVTNWRFYDTIYTERYLKTPQLNPSGYDDNSPINFAKDLKGKYFLVHGTADDNVHLQNSTEWTNSLVGANKDFDMFYYTNKNHGIYGGYTRYHLYNKMTNFLLENL